MLEINLTNDKRNPKGLSEISDTSDQTFPSPLRAIPKSTEPLPKAVARPWAEEPHQHAFSMPSEDMLLILCKPSPNTLCTTNVIPQPAEKKEGHA